MIADYSIHNSSFIHLGNKCESLAIADVILEAKDRSDFNKGGKFEKWGITWRDDWFRWGKAVTPLGYDYNISSWKRAPFLIACHYHRFPRWMVC